MWRHLGCAMVGLVIVASLLPLAELPGPDVPLKDKWLHLLAWGSLAAWFGQIASSTGARMRTAAILLAISGLIEVAQILVPFRDGDWADLVANGIGLAAGTLFSAAIRVPEAFLARDA